MTDQMQCPMHPHPQPCLVEGQCPVCGREWEMKNGNMMSKPRRVRIVAPLVEGAKIDDCLKEV